MNRKFYGKFEEENFMKIRYAIEKEIEVPDDYSDEMIDNVIKAKCEEEKGFDYLWQDADEPNDLFSN